MEKEPTALITITYDTGKGVRGSNDFSSLLELKKWLDKHPKFAKLLGYDKAKG
jgi:hypothetical protein